MFARSIKSDVNRSPVKSILQPERNKVKLIKIKYLFFIFKIIVKKVQFHTYQNIIYYYLRENLNYNYSFPVDSL